jgi:hypothetical protein
VQEDAGRFGGGISVGAEAAHDLSGPAEAGFHAKHSRPLRARAKRLFPISCGTSKGKPMATSLYDLSVPTFLQTVSAVAGFLDRAARHCVETGADHDDFVNARLFDDMAPFHFQIEATAHHSVWGLEAVKNGVFAPPALVGSMPFADLQTMIDQAKTALEALTPR